METPVIRIHELHHALQALCRNMYGPTLIELQIITGTDIDKISTVFTWLGAGGITGSLAYGFLYDRFPTAPIIVTTLVLLCGVTCLIPVCKWIVIMMILCSIQAFLFNGISIGKFDNIQSTNINSRHVKFMCKRCLVLLFICFTSLFRL